MSSSDNSLQNQLSFSEISSSSTLLELCAKNKEDDICNLCGQKLSEVKSKDIQDRKSFYVCFSCKTAKLFSEDKSIKIVIE